MSGDRIAVVGAGVGGLVAALHLAGRGLDVTVFERAAGPGGKMRTMFDGPHGIDAGPTVFTLKRVFEEIFAEVGLDFDALVPTRRARTLARHAWSAQERLDLFADIDESADAIAAFAGGAQAQAYRLFCKDAARTWRALEKPFVRARAPSLARLIAHGAMHGLSDLAAIRPFETLSRSLGRHFDDPRLRQLFGRYATYCGSSPFDCPATLMLVAHVEQEGVWLVDGGMRQLALVLEAQARALGARFRYGEDVSELAFQSDGVRLALKSAEAMAFDRVVFNGDPQALAGGLMGAAARRAVAKFDPAARSLSAVTWCFAAPTEGFALLRHNVFFSRDYAAEFDALRAGRLIEEPTVYVCAQDRADEDAPISGPDRMLVLVNAPATGDRDPYGSEDIASCLDRAMTRLAACGLTIRGRPRPAAATTPAGFAQMFPGTGGALYGMASHGWTASFRRPGARTRIPRLYLAGGGAHPGPGVPMAALSGAAAAASLLSDLVSRGRSRATATRGGMSTPSATTAPTG